MSVKIKALITLVVGKSEEVLPGNICEVSDDEARRLISLRFAERVKVEKQPVKEDPKNGKPDGKSGEQPVPTTGPTGKV